MTRGHANVPVCRAAGVVLLGTSRRVINLRDTVKAYEKGAPHDGGAIYSR